MEVVIVGSVEEAAAVAAAAIEQVLDSSDHPVLGLATGSSPLPIYAELVARHERGELSFANARAFLLDEYVGLPVGHPGAYRTFIRREFTDRVDLSDLALHGPDGTSADIAAAARFYEEQIAASGGIDLQLLGIGSDGHIGFNEPASSLASRTRIKTLTDTTRSDNARFFDDDLEQVPRHVLTQGVGTILEARHLLLIATGAAKAEPVALAVEGPLTSMVPASALQLHPHATVIVDEAAAAGLRNARYYREAFTNKPAWQRI